MSQDQQDDQLLRVLGRLARTQNEASPPADLAQPSAAAQAKARDVALAALGTAPAALPAKKRRFGVWSFVVAAPALAAAAGAVLWLRAADPSARLPAYALEVAGGIAEKRAPSDATPLLLEPGTPLELRLRPAVTVTGPVATQIFWVKDGQAQRWSVLAESAPGGALRVRGAAERPFGAGEGRVIAIVGRPDRLLADTPGTDVARLEAPSPDRQIFSWPVRWR